MWQKKEALQALKWEKLLQKTCPDQENITQKSLEQT